jgi:dihydrodipicolinate synthase/N-acetylneuraminate lyase
MKLRFDGLDRRRFLQFLTAGAVGAAGLPVFAASGAKSLRGIFPIAQSPFTEADKLDLDCLTEQVRFLDRGRVHGCVWPQIASEWPTLTESERMAGAEAMVATAKKLHPAIVIGVQAPEVATAVKYAKHAAKLGADALISLPPTGANAQAVLEYYKTVGGATSLPLFAQAVGDLSVDQLVAMYKAVPTLRYVKDEAGQPLERIGPLREKTSDELKVFTGMHGRTMIEEMMRGFSGSMPAAGFADLYAAAWDLWHEGKQREAVDMFGKAAVLIEEVLVYGTESLKYILCLRGVFKTYRTREKAKAGRTQLDAGAKKALAEILDLMKPYLRA